MKLKNEEIIAVVDTLSKIEEMDMDIDGVYWVLDTNQKLQNQYEVIKDAIKKTQNKSEEYNVELRKLVNKYGKRDDNNKVVYENGNLVLDEEKGDIEETKNKFVELRDKYKDTLKNVNEDIDKVLNKEVDIKDIEKIHKSYLPKILKPSDIKPIFKLIER